MMIKSYLMLATLVQAYFHQDFEEPDDLAGFAEFARTHSAADRAAFVADVREFLADHAQSLLDSFVRIFRPDLVLADNDEDLREWLERAVVAISPM